MARAATAPTVSAPAVAPAEALRVLAATERRLRGDRSGDATVFVVPTGNTGPIDLPPGMANGRDAWVFASADRATYLHEYVHVEQEFRSGTRMAWFGEASASYLTRYLSMTYGLSGVFPFEVFATLVDRRGGTAGDAVLTRPETWGHYTEYRAGRTLLAALDARIRERTDGRRSFLDVFARLNRNSDLANASQWTRQVHTHASYRELRTVVAALAGDATARWLDEHVTTPARPSVRATRDTYEFGLAYFEDHPDARPTYDVDRGSNVTVPVRLDATRTATLRIATDRGRVNVSVHDADGDGRADVEFVPASRAGGEPAVRAADPHDWAVAWGLALDAPLSPGRHELRLSTSDDSPRFPDSRATLRIDGTSNGPIRNASTGPAPEPMRSSP